MTEMVMKPILVHSMMGLPILLEQTFHSRFGLCSCTWDIQDTLTDSRWECSRHDGRRVQVASKCLGRAESGYSNGSIYH